MFFSPPFLLDFDRIYFLRKCTLLEIRLPTEQTPCQEQGGLNLRGFSMGKLRIEVKGMKRCNYINPIKSRCQSGNP